MKACLNCQKEFLQKREHAKYCSDKCRVAYNRKNPKKNVTPVQMRVLYNEIMSAVEKLNNSQPQSGNTLSLERGALIPNPIQSEQVPLIKNFSFNELKIALKTATSEVQLSEAWGLVEKTEDLANWQLSQLSAIKEEQRTKIDF